MRTKKLGYTDLNLTTVGLGTWAIGGGGWKYGWGPQDDKESIAAIRAALDLGINWIDTAAVYGLGHAEEVVGRAVKEAPQEPIIATKCGRVWDEKGNIGGSLKKKSVRSEAEASLRRLGVDVIDVYQIHWPDPDEDIEQAWEMIAELIEEGKIRYGGVSNFSVEQLKRIQSIHPVASLQPPYSMIVRDIEKEILPYCEENNIGVICYSPMYKGLLAGKFTKERIQDLPQDDHRRGDTHFQEPEIDVNLEFVDKLRSIAEERGRTVAQLAIAWVLRRPEVTAAIVGARRPSQIEETAPAGNWVLSEDEIKAIDALLQEREEKLG